MQIQLNHIAGREGVLREVGEEEFVDDARTCHPNRTLLVPGGMCGHDHAAGYSFRSHWKLWTIVEAACCLAFRTLLDLRMIEQVVVFAARHKRKRGHIGEHGPIAILPIKARASCVLAEGGGSSDTGQWRRAPCAVPPDIARSHDCQPCPTIENCAPATPLFVS